MSVMRYKPETEYPQVRWHTAGGNISKNNLAPDLLPLVPRMAICGSCMMVNKGAEARRKTFLREYPQGMDIEALSNFRSNATWFGY